MCRASALVLPQLVWNKEESEYLHEGTPSLLGFVHLSYYCHVLSVLKGKTHLVSFTITIRN